MKHFLKGWLALVFVLVLCICCAENKTGTKELKYKEFWEYTPQEWFDNKITHSVVTDSAGHTLILHETGTRGWRDYSMSIEHSPECKKCCEIYD